MDGRTQRGAKTKQKIHTEMAGAHRFDFLWIQSIKSSCHSSTCVYYCTIFTLLQVNMMYTKLQQAKREKATTKNESGEGNDRRPLSLTTLTVTNGHSINDQNCPLHAVCHLVPVAHNDWVYINNGLKPCLFHTSGVSHIRHIYTYDYWPRLMTHPLHRQPRQTPTCLRYISWGLKHVGHTHNTHVQHRVVNHSSSRTYTTNYITTRDFACRHVLVSMFANLNSPVSFFKLSWWEINWACPPCSLKSISAWWSTHLDLAP